MPTYSYFCFACNKDFEIFSYISNYQEKPKCIFCKSKKTNRLYDKDVLTQFCSVKKSDSELKTIGDLAQRNSDKMSKDHKITLYQKHNDYKDNVPSKELPKGMSRMKKPKKPKWRQ